MIVRLVFCHFIAIAALPAWGLGQQIPSRPAPPGIQDNSFLIEEAYNQEAGIVQHISSFARFVDSKDWAYTFTQEWPAPRNPRHQFSYTLAVLHFGKFSRSAAGIGDVLLNYRYQVIGNAESRLAFAPRFSLICPTGQAAAGTGAGGLGVQTNFPVSVVVSRKFVTHWNAGVTFIPHSQNSLGDRSSSTGYNFGQSLIFLAHPRVHVLVETVFIRVQSVVASDKTQWSQSFYVNPGIRWAYNFSNGLQIVPGVSVPIGVGPGYGEKGIFLYLSFEHPFAPLKKSEQSE